MSRIVHDGNLGQKSGWFIAEDNGNYRPYDQASFATREEAEWEMREEERITALNAERWKGVWEARGDAEHRALERIRKLESQC